MKIEVRTTKSPSPNQVRPLIAASIGLLAFSYMAINERNVGGIGGTTYLGAILSLSVLLGISIYNRLQVLTISENAIEFKGEIIQFSEIETIVRTKEETGTGQLNKYVIRLKDGREKDVPAHFWSQNKVDVVIKEKLAGKILNIERLIDL